MSKENIILEDEAEKLIEQVTLDVWKVNEQKYFVKKDKAIEFVTTHKKCECGDLMEKYRSKCHKCQSEEWSNQSHERYLRKPIKEWDGKTFLTIYNTDVFFEDESEIQDYLSENDLKIEDLELCICEPNHLPTIDYDEMCVDIMPENIDDLSRLCPEVLNKINELNEFIKNHKPISWTEGIYRTNVTLTNEQ